MNVSTLLASVRARISDPNKVGYSDIELIDYLNSAQIAITKRLAAAGNHQFIKSMTLSSGDPVPPRFLGFVGDYPIRIEGGKMYVTPSRTITARYIQAPLMVTSLAENISFDDIHIPALINTTCILALNRNEFDVSQDVQIGEALSVARVKE